MKVKLITTYAILSLIFTFGVKGQVGLHKIFGYPFQNTLIHGSGVLATNDDLVVAYESTGYLGKCMVTKFSKGGSTVWTRYISGCQSASVVRNRISNNGFVVVGNNGFGLGYVGLLDSSGTLIRSAEFTGVVLQDVVVTSGGYCLVGRTSTSNGYLAYVDTNLSVIWERSQWLSTFQRGTNVGNERIALLGDFDFVTLYDTAGTLLWQNRYTPTAASLNLKAITSSDSGNIVVSGVLTAGSADAFIMKLDSAGAVLWSNSYGGPDNDLFGSITSTKDGDMFAVGRTWSFGHGQEDVLAVKVTTQGHAEWAQVYGGSAREQSAIGLERDDDSFVLLGIAAYLSSGPSNNGLYLIESDSLGRTFNSCMEDTAALDTMAVALSITSWDNPVVYASAITTPNDSSLLVSLSDSLLCCLFGGFQADSVCIGEAVNFVDTSYGDILVRYWHYGDGERDTFTVVTNPTHTYTDTGTYTVTLTTVNAQNPNCYRNFTQTVVVHPSPPLDLGSDTVLCDGDVMTLDAGPSGPYSWWDGDSVQTKMVSTDGNYWVSIADSICPVTDTVTVSTSTTPNLSFPTDTILCTGDVISLSVDSGFTYIWSTGATTHAINISNGGTYTVLVSNSGCEAMLSIFVEEEGCGGIYVPNAFTPNGDGVNDRLQLYVIGGYKLHQFSIYNRWGEVVFATDSEQHGWDGRYKGDHQPTGSYVYLVKGSDQNGSVVELKGDIALIR